MNLKHISTIVSISLTWLLSTPLYAQQWQIFNTHNSGIAGNDIRSISIDNKNGAVWVAADSGASKYDGNAWNTLTHDPAIFEINLDHSSVPWTTSYYGFAVFNDTANKYLSRGGVFNGMFIDSSNVKWVASQNSGITGDSAGGFLRSNDTVYKYYTIYNSGVLDKNMYDITVDKKGIVWGAGFKGLTKFDYRKNIWKLYNMYKSINFIASDQRNIKWLSRNNNDTLLSFNDSVFTAYKLSTYTGGANVTSRDIFVDQFNNKWIGLSKGFLKYDNKKWVYYDSTQYAYLNSTVYTFAQDNKGVMWIGTNKGLIKWTGLVGIDENNNNKTQLNIYPNPFNSSAIITYQHTSNTNPSNLHLQITDLAGHAVVGLFTYQRRDENSFIIEQHGAAQGLYFIQVFSDNTILGTAKLILN